VTTLAGTAGAQGSADGTGSAAQFFEPYGVAVDSTGNVYVADIGNDTIRKISPGGVVTTLAGTAGAPGSADGTGSAARFDSPIGVAVDSTGNVYVADNYDDTIRKITPGGVVTTLAGTAGTQGSADGTGSAARFYAPSGVAVDSTGNVYVADTSNDTIREITPGGVVTTLAGTAYEPGSADGTGSAARFNGPFGVAVDSTGNVYVADTGNDTIRKITPAGVVTTLAGTAYEPGSADGTGSAARFNGPFGVAVDSTGNVYVADTLNDTIRKITPGGVVTTLAGTAGAQGSADGTGSAARFYAPSGVAVDSADNVYVADVGNGTIRKITPGGVVTTLAGAAGIVGSADGTGSAALFHAPYGVAVDSTGNVYVADTKNDTIRKITPGGVVTTLAGTPGVRSSADGTGSAARFNKPSGVAVDSAGNVYVADVGNGTIRKITPGGVVTTLAGTAGVSGSADGTGSAALFYAPSGAAVGSTGNVYVADTLNNNIRLGSAITGGSGGSSSASLINISTRAQVGTGANILISGFVIGGSGTETLLIRADGPGLSAFGVTGVLAVPSLSVFDTTGKIIASNTGWGTNANPALIASTAASVGAFALASGSADCALIAVLPAGAYTVQVSGVGNTTGVALAEIYEVSSSGTRLVNISTRAQVGTGANILISGFVIAGTGTEQLLARADGPSLTTFGVPGVLAAPSLGVFNGAGAEIASNTGWGTNSNAAQIASTAAKVGAFALPSGSADSALLGSLPAGAYTLQISGVNNTTGVALAEVYEVP
jgi:sugar lactone lactonase YvrE